jgi:hypothetical protein
MFILLLRYGVKYTSGSLGIILARYMWPKLASHKSNPSSVLRGIERFFLYSTLGHEGGGNSCGWYTLMGVATTHAG